MGATLVPLAAACQHPNPGLLLGANKGRGVAHTHPSTFCRFLTQLERPALRAEGRKTPAELSEELEQL